MDSLPAHVAIINKDGVIIETNRAWSEFAADNDIDIIPDTIGRNYLEICDMAKGDQANMARTAAEGIRYVISGRRDEFVLNYPCEAPRSQRWFKMRVTRLAPPKPILVMISHEDISEVQEALDGLYRREVELENQARKLKESIIAMRVLLDEREQAKHEVEENILATINKEVLPYIEMVKRGSLSDEQKKSMELIESNIQEIISPFAYKLTSNNLNFTPMEIRVACLIKDGYTNKEISSSLNLSIRTIEFHRSNIRRKLGLSGRKNNLHMHLQSMS